MQLDQAQIELPPDALDRPVQEAEVELEQIEEPPPEEDLPPPPVNPFVLTANDRLSTFAMDVDTAAYSIAR